MEPDKKQESGFSKKFEWSAGALSWRRRQLLVDHNPSLLRCTSSHRQATEDIPLVPLGDCLTLWCVLVVYNENLTRALKTTSLKWSLPSTNTTDRQEKIYTCVWRFKVTSCKCTSLKSTRFLQKRSDVFLTDLIYRHWSGRCRTLFLFFNIFYQVLELVHLATGR